MIIISQDKKMLANFENIVSITIVSFENDHSVYAISGDLENLILGTYPTEKRAMDVLDKIVNARGLGMYAYQMPKK